MDHVNILEVQLLCSANANILRKLNIHNIIYATFLLQNFTDLLNICLLSGKDVSENVSISI
jgi:hypothetical protein